MLSGRHLGSAARAPERRTRGHEARSFFAVDRCSPARARVRRLSSRSRSHDGRSSDGRDSLRIGCPPPSDQGHRRGRAHAAARGRVDPHASCRSVADPSCASRRRDGGASGGVGNASTLPRVADASAASVDRAVGAGSSEHRTQVRLQASQEGCTEVEAPRLRRRSDLIGPSHHPPPRGRSRSLCRGSWSSVGSISFPGLTKRWRCSELRRPPSWERSVRS